MPAFYRRRKVLSQEKNGVARQHLWRHRRARPTISIIMMLTMMQAEGLFYAIGDGLSLGFFRICSVRLFLLFAQVFCHEGLTL